MNKIRILLVDDNPGLLDMLEDGIGRFCTECHVSSATDGFAALDQLRRQSFDLVLTDYNMPGMNGLELAYVVRQTLPETRVVLMTAYGDGATFQHRIRAMELEDTLRKPFNWKQIRDIVEGTTARVEPSLIT